MWEFGRFSGSLEGEKARMNAKIFGLLVDRLAHAFGDAVRDVYRHA